ncbi:response regulator [Paenibacillus sp. KQZ6P-2]|uniref:Response regulator n=1 Tax=Paenibacillus mangrovi TaxID=2931978 RepID=A0A9X2B497_9BACL|nr:response regulator [Paenibacillus mangrovi]MCJ8010848.1 response regulator [Paenibacillus mangrovi]
MIKVLIVDDDKFVRMGLMSVMPWQQFGMQVVGEANNGERALKLLETQDVDLLLTDLAMPVMSGIELIRIARERYPRLHIVVLTLHQDFAYVQEALRLGAIDYVVKVELEKEQFAEVLGRIEGRIQAQAVHGTANRSQDDVQIHIGEKGYIVVRFDHHAGGEWNKGLHLSTDVNVIEVDRNCWLLISRHDRDDELCHSLLTNMRSMEKCIVIELSDLHGFTLNEIQRWVRDFKERELFYSYQPHISAISVCIHKGSEHLAEPAEEDLERLKDQWLSAEWLYHDGLFEKLVLEIKLLRMPQAKLIGLLYAFVNEWNRLFSQSTLGRIKLVEPIYSWYQVEQWLKSIRGLTQHAADKTSYSQEIIHCILNAEQMMRSELDQPLTAADMSKRINMSRSYFSQCFKDIIGNTFIEHIRRLRMEKAKQYLLSTNKTIQWIAEHTGYMDEKYFSRTFRDQTGMLPSEYRSRKRTHSDNGRVKEENR